MREPLGILKTISFWTKRPLSQRETFSGFSVCRTSLISPKDYSYYKWYWVKAVTIEFDEPSSTSTAACRGVLALAGPTTIKGFNWLLYSRDNWCRTTHLRMAFLFSSLRAETFWPFLFWIFFFKDVHFFMIHINNKITWSQVVIKALKTLQRFQNHPPTVSAAGINEAKICQDTKVVQTCLYGYWKSLRQNNMQNVKQPRASLQNYLYWDLHCF